MWGWNEWLCHFLRPAVKFLSTSMIFYLQIETFTGIVSRTNSWLRVWSREFNIHDFDKFEIFPLFDCTTFPLEAKMLDTKLPWMDICHYTGLHLMHEQCRSVIKLNCAIWNMFCGVSNLDVMLWLERRKIAASIKNVFAHSFRKWFIDSMVERRE